MESYNLSHQQLFALSLTAPILVTGPNPSYNTLATDTPQASANLLSSWWDITTEEDLRKTLHWLENEGGHTVYFIQCLKKLERMSFLQRRDYIAELMATNRDEYVRAKLTEHYRLDLGRFTVLAFDIARITLLVRTGHDVGWIDEQEAWTLLLRQADKIITNRMWDSHFDYLYSYMVGRAFGMKKDVAGIIESVNTAHALLTNHQSPWLSYAPWPKFTETDVAENSNTKQPLH